MLEAVAKEGDTSAIATLLDQIDAYIGIVQPSQEFGEINAADGQAQAGATVFAAGAAVGLLKGFEDDLLLVAGIPIPVSVTEMAMTDWGFELSLSLLHPPATAGWPARRALDA